MIRFQFCSIVSALMLGLSSTAAQADPTADFYSRTNIRLLVSGEAGGSYDTDARLVARYWGRHIPGNPTIIPENMLGASGRAAASYTYNVAPKDGSVIAVVQQTIAMGQALDQSGVQYDAAKFNWIGSPVRNEEVLVVWHTTGVRTIEDAKKKEVVIGATSQTGTNYIYPKLTNELLGTKFKIVTGYSGGAPIVLALERGEVEGRGANPWSEWKVIRPDWVRDKKIIPLIQMSLAKRPDLPEVPLLIDLAPNADVRSIFELVSITGDIGRPFATAPGVPAERVAALRKAFDETIRDPDFLADAEKVHKEIHLITGEELDALVKRVLSAPKSATELLKAALSAKSVPAK
jgi:tripartite-type tricarboxylate transporter receptor subunit TctC